jgi:hypothetical protein
MICVAESEENKEAILAKLYKLNQEGEQYMKHAERRNVTRLNWENPLLPRGIVVDWLVPGILLSPLVACQEDLEPGQFKADCLEMPD